MSDQISQADADRLIARIQKLLALSQNNPSQAEAEAAAAKVQELVSQYNIDLAQVENDTATGPTYEKREKTPHDRSAMYNYQQSLMQQLAQNNFCMHFVREMAVHSNGKMRKAKRHMLLGRKVNIISTIMTYDYLVDTFDALLPFTGMEKRGKAALAWLDGCTHAVVGRLEQRRAQQLRESQAAQQARPTSASGGKALVLSEVYSTEEDLNNDAFYNREPGTTARRRKEREAEAAQRQAELAAKERRLVEEEGYSIDDAWHVARGYPVPSQERLGGTSETDAQRAKREEREAREWAKYQEQQYRRAYKQERRQSNPHFQAGRKTGMDIGLDVQVGQDKLKAIR